MSTIKTQIEELLDLAEDDEEESEIIPCPVDCGGCSCHISPPCPHCVEGHGMEKEE